MTTLQIGDTRTKRYLFDAAAISVFAAGAGDLNPLHHDPDFAAGTKFGGVIASGAHMVAVLMGFGATFISEYGEAVGLEFSYRFQKALAAGTNAILLHRITAIEPHAKLGGRLLTFESSITDDAGVTYVTSTGKAVIFDKPPSTG